MNKSNYTLGIDMGVASIGWAVVSTDVKSLDCGVRVFPAGVDNINSPKEKHPNLDRRSARGMRRRIRRKAERKALICQHLQELGWMPIEPQV
jgi:CRISPR-associated endonuclease Csn1